MVLCNVMYLADLELQDKRVEDNECIVEAAFLFHCLPNSLKYVCNWLLKNYTIYKDNKSLYVKAHKNIYIYRNEYNNLMVDLSVICAPSWQ